MGPSRHNLAEEPDSIGLSELDSTGLTFGTSFRQQHSKPEAGQIPEPRFQASDFRLQPRASRLITSRRKEQVGKAGVESCILCTWDLRVQTPDSRFKTLDFRLQSPDFTFQTSHVQLQTPDATLQTPDCRFQILDFRVWVSGSRFQFKVPGSRSQNTKS